VSKRSGGIGLELGRAVGADALGGGDDALEDDAMLDEAEHLTHLLVTEAQAARAQNNSWSP
jgi:hypothetical protein